MYAYIKYPQTASTFSPDLALAALAGIPRRPPRRSASSAPITTTPIMAAAPVYKQKF